MRTLGFGLVLLGTVLKPAFGCGGSAGDTGSAGGGSSGAATAGSSSSAGVAGKAGASSTAGTTSGGGAAGGSGTGADGVSGSVATSGGQPDAQAGAGNEAGTGSGLSDCDPNKILCKRLAPECLAGEVPSVDGNCYSDCVKVEHCVCDAAEQCPQLDQYTCWAKQHCGPFVQ